MEDRIEPNVLFSEVAMTIGVSCYLYTRKENDVDKPTLEDIPQ